VSTRRGLSIDVLATPDFGASATEACVLAIVWAVVLLLVAWGVMLGIGLIHGGSPRARRLGVLLLLVSASVPLSCCLGLPLVVRLVYGNYPLGRYPNGKITEGMTADEVVAVLGMPHQRLQLDDAERWYYWIDSFGMSYFGVTIGPDGRVKDARGN
jgi:hypothetical protein